LQKKSHFAKSAKKSAKRAEPKNISFPILNPWVLRNIRQGGDHQICEKKAKSLHPTLEGYVKEKQSVPMKDMMTTREQMTMMMMSGMWTTGLLQTTKK